MTKQQLLTSLSKAFFFCLPVIALMPIQSFADVPLIAGIFNKSSNSLVDLATEAQNLILNEWPVKLAATAGLAMGFFMSLKTSSPTPFVTILFLIVLFKFAAPFVNSVFGAA